MAFPYSSEIEDLMKTHFDGCNEKGRRRYAAVEALKLGHGGINYIGGLFDIDVRTIRRGIEELKKTADAPGTVSATVGVVERARRRLGKRKY